MKQLSEKRTKKIILESRNLKKDIKELIIENDELIFKTKNFIKQNQLKKENYLFENNNFKNHQNYILGNKIKKKIILSSEYSKKTGELIGGFNPKKRKQILKITSMYNQNKDSTFLIIFLIILFSPFFYLLYPIDKKAFFFFLYFIGGFILFLIFIKIISKIMTFFKKEENNYLFYKNKNEITILKK